MSDESPPQKKQMGRPPKPGGALKKIGVALRPSDLEALKRFASEALVGDPQAALSMIERGERPGISAGIRWLIDQEKLRRAIPPYVTYHIRGGGIGRLLLSWELVSGREVVQTHEIGKPIIPPRVPKDYDSLSPEDERSDLEEELAEAEERREVAGVTTEWHEGGEPRLRRKRRKTAGRDSGVTAGRVLGGKASPLTQLMATLQRGRPEPKRKRR